MTDVRDLDGRAAQGWGGSTPDGVHVNVFTARRGSPTAAAMTAAFAAPSQGFTPILVCTGASQQAYETLQPPTILLTKSAPATEFAETLVFGAVQVGTARAVLDTVAAGRLAADSEHLVFVSVWLDPQAQDETAVKDAARAAVTHALTEAIEGPDPRKVRALLEGRETITHPFYRGR
jgi:formaldehyde-activating enzyme